MLSKCNHTILSYGTFSFWAGFLCKGKRIIPSMIINQMEDPLEHGLHAFTMTDEGLTYESNAHKMDRMKLKSIFVLDVVWNKLRCHAKILHIGIATINSSCRVIQPCIWIIYRAITSNIWITLHAFACCCVHSMHSLIKFILLPLTSITYY